MPVRLWALKYVLLGDVQGQENTEYHFNNRAKLSEKKVNSKHRLKNRGDERRLLPPEVKMLGFRVDIYMPHEPVCRKHW